MRFLRIILILGWIFLSVIACQNDSTGNQKEYIFKRTPADYRSLSGEAQSFIRAHNLRNDIYILIDFSIHSGKKRLFVWDFNQNKITHQYLVSHGCCDQSWGSDRSKENPRFSNSEGSHCSSLGKYIVGERGWSNWGVNTKYLMHGMESANTNALRRAIVFHSWERVSDSEIYPQGTPEGWGCPAVSNQAFREIDQLLQASGKRALMWAIY